VWSSHSRRTYGCQEEKFGRLEEEESQPVGRAGEDCLHLSAEGAVHEERACNRTIPRLQESFSEGAASGMRMLTYFINRGGKGLSATRRAELEKAKKLLSKRVAAEREARERKKAA